MTERNWTPGEWRVDGGQITSDELHEMDCIVSHVCGGKANAHLISAAPDMYEALTELILKVKLIDHECEFDLCLDAEQALAKAKGEI